MKEKEVNRLIEIEMLETTLRIEGRRLGTWGKQKSGNAH